MVFFIIFITLNYHKPGNYWNILTNEIVIRTIFIEILYKLCNSTLYYYILVLYNIIIKNNLKIGRILFEVGIMLPI